MVNAGLAEQASGWFYKAVTLSLADDPQAAIEAAHHARRLDAGQVPGWLGLLVEPAPRHPSIVSLSQALTEAPDPSGP
jgi:hypothetical protein